MRRERGAPEIKGKRKKAASSKEKEGENDVYVCPMEKRNFCQKVVQLIIFRQSICIVSPLSTGHLLPSLNHHDC